MSGPRTLFDKIWEAHLVDQQEDGTCLLYVDRHLVHEVTSPQAFEGLRQSGRRVRRPDATLAVPDHNVPTTDRARGIAEEQSRIQIETLQQNCREFGIPLFDVTDVRQVKGLQFDYVVLLEVSRASYPTQDEARHLLHIAATRAAHQLWVTSSGEPSMLLPESLRDRAY